MLDIEPDNNCYWLTDTAYNCGIIEASKDGVSEISWQEIKAWCDINDQNAWIAGVIKQFSREYVTQYYKANHNHCAPPIEMEQEKKPVAGAEQLKAFLRGRK